MDKSDRHYNIDPGNEKWNLFHILHNIFPGMCPVPNVSSNHVLGKTIQYAVSLNYWEGHPHFQLRSRPQSSIIWIKLWAAKEYVPCLSLTYCVVSGGSLYVSFLQFPLIKKFGLLLLLPISLLCLQSLLCKLCVCRGGGGEQGEGGREKWTQTAV